MLAGKKRYCLGLLSLFCLTGSAYCEETPPLEPRELEKHLTQAEKDFAIAEEMFDPYYTGPLLAPGVTIPDPGHFAVQPYLFVTRTYGQYDNKGHAHSIPHIHTITGNFLAFAGITKWMGLQFATGYTRNRQSGNTGSNWTDTSLTLLFPLLKEDLYRPGILVAVRESFPTGKYQNLNSQKGGVDATGVGAYQTSFFLNFAKMLWSLPTHPMRFRLSMQYSVPAHVRVHNFNAFGGGFCTNAKVKLPNAFAADFGYELSFNQKWAFALDILYTYAAQTNFSGFAGFTTQCTPAGLGGPESQQLSLAPALEYSVRDNYGFILGSWFTVLGRNSRQFVSGVFSFYVAW